VSGEPELTKYQSGEWVQYLQQQLQYQGYYNGQIDGEFGDDLETAVRSYQSAYGLNADGVVRQDTWDSFQSGGQSSQTDPGEQVLEVDWASEFPELHALANASDFDEYVRNVVGVDPEMLKTESSDAVA